MNKPLRVAVEVVARDLQAIYDYHRSFSQEKADRIVEEYDRIVALIELNPCSSIPVLMTGGCILSIPGPTSCITKSCRSSGW